MFLSCHVRDCVLLLAQYKYYVSDTNKVQIKYKSNVTSFPLGINNPHLVLPQFDKFSYHQETLLKCLQYFYLLVYLLQRSYHL